jgi:hypothetical protein
MKPWLLILLLWGLLVSCDNFEWEDSFPTVLLQVGDVNTTRKTVTIDKVDHQEYTLEFSVGFTALPGSPEGVIRYLTTTTGQILAAGTLIPSKPASASLCDETGDCDTKTVQYRFVYPLDVAPSTMILASYTAESTAGKVRTFELGTPQPVYLPLSSNPTHR